MFSLVTARHALQADHHLNVVDRKKASLKADRIRHIDIPFIDNFLEVAEQANLFLNIFEITFMRFISLKVNFLLLQSHY